MTNPGLEDSQPIDPTMVAQVDELNEEVRILALNLAIYLARVKGKSPTLSRLEPDFIRLVNGTVKAVHELTGIINAARNREVMVNDLADRSPESDPVFQRLNGILSQCHQIMQALAEEGRLDTTG